ncbi:MAG: AMP-binding protein, partial [Gemmatimonadota bacterium]
MSFEGSSLNSVHLADAFEAAALRGPDRSFIVSGIRRLSYAQVDQEARALAAALADLGIEPGDRIAVILPNWPEWVVTLLATAFLGGTIVPINPALGYHELKYQLRHAEASIIVTAPSYEGRDFLEWFDELIGELPDVLYLVAVGNEDFWYDDRVFPYRELVSKGARLETPAAPRDPDATLAILYTSGTMGKPKGVCLSHRNVVETAWKTVEALGVTPEDVSLVAVPCFTIFCTSMVVGGIVAGVTLVLQENFGPARTVELVAREQVTLLH